MCSCFRSRAPVYNTNNEFKKKKEDHHRFNDVETTVSLSISTQLKDVTVRIVHAGGRIEMYHKPIRASTMIQRYPGMCIALPDVFQRPNESVLSEADVLLPGRKYFAIRSTTVEKLKRRDLRKGRDRTRVVKFEEPKLMKSAQVDDTVVEDDDGDCVMVSEDSFCSAKDFYISKENWSSCVSKQRLTGKKKNKPFKPPIKKPRPMREAEWEPSLRSIKELSP